jgi:hypothetical protein
MLRGAISTVLLLLLAVPLAAGVDLAKIDRAIAKEPAYQTKNPKYSLLVFGTEAKTRVWVVLDGKTLYVDCNADGDLTSPGERFDALPDTDRQRGLAFAEITLRLPQEPGQKLEVSVSDNSPSFTLNGEGLPTQWAWGDTSGELSFGTTLKDAPIIHFRGPLTIGLFKVPTFSPGKTTELQVLLGTNGLGTGTFVSTSYAPVPDTVHPQAVIEFAGKNGSPVSKRYVLGKRC